MRGADFCVQGWADASYTLTERRLVLASFGVRLEGEDGRVEEQAALFAPCSEALQTSAAAEIAAGHRALGLARSVWPAATHVHLYLDCTATLDALGQLSRRRQKAMGMRVTVEHVPAHRGRGRGRATDRNIHVDLLARRALHEEQHRVRQAALCAHRAAPCPHTVPACIEAWARSGERLELRVTQTEAALLRLGRQIEASSRWLLGH
jgi:hypothetical protein